MTMHRSADWQKSSFSGTESDNHCLELAALPHGPALRESDDPAVVPATTPARLGAPPSGREPPARSGISRPGLAGSIVIRLFADA
jgi:uncharacterized protein DUF397